MIFWFSISLFYANWFKSDNFRHLADQIRRIGPALLAKIRREPTRLTGTDDWSGIRTHASEETSALN